MQGIGAKWTNLFENPMSDDDFSVGWAIIFMLIDAFVYLTLTWYLEHVLPGRFLPNIIWNWKKSCHYPNSDANRKKTSVQLNLII